MSEFSIKSNILSAKEKELDAIAKKLLKYSRDIDRKRSSIDYNTRSKAKLNSTLSNIASNVENCSNKSSVMSDRLSQAVRLYETTEKEIANVEFKSSGSTRKLSGEKTEESNWAWEALKKFLKKGGFFGGAFGIVEGVLDFIDSVNAGSLGEIFKSAVGVAKPVYSATSGFLKKLKNMKKVKHLLPDETYKKSWWDSILGLTDYYGKGGVGKASVAKSFSKRLKTNLKNSWKKEIGKGMAVSAIFSGLVNIAENFSEAYNGEMTWDRAIKEVVGETAVDVLSGAAITAGVAAVLAATPIGAPAILVGGVSVLISMGLDGITKHFTNGEKDFSELFSDTVIDFGEKIGNLGKQIGTKVLTPVRDACVDTINKIGEKTGEFIGNATKNIGGFFSKLLPA